MGVMLELYIDFSKINSKQWENVYNESLKLIDSYEFMDIITGKEKDSDEFVYADRSRERYLNPSYPDYIGWQTVGDMKTFERAESFMLVKDIGFYLKNNSGTEDKDKSDIYFSIINHRSANEDIKNVETNDIMVFNSKTQGCQYHKYLLAIACLIEDRLKPNVVIFGDITLGQIKYSFELANSILEKKISLPDRCNYENLYNRVVRVLKNETAQIEAFLDLVLSPNNKELGDFLRKYFSAEGLRNYWKRYLKDCKPGTLGMSLAIKEFLELNFYIAILCDILVLDDNQEFMGITNFIKALLVQGILNEGNKEKFLTINNQEQQTPETVESLFGKSLLSMKGLRDQAQFYISESDLKKILYDKLKDETLINRVIEDYKNEKNNTNINTNIIDTLLEKMKDKVENKDINLDNFDILNSEDLLYWEEGDRIHPNLENILQKINDFTNELVKEKLQELPVLTLTERTNILIKYNQSFIIRKQTWDFIFKNISEDNIYYKILALFCIDAQEMTINKIMKSIFNNLDLLKYCFITQK